MSDPPTPSPPAPAPAPHDVDTEPPLDLAGLAYFTPLYEHVVLADRKATFFLSAGGLMLTVLGFFLSRIERVLAADALVAWALGLTLAIVVVLVVVAGVMAYLAFARLLPPTPPSLIVFRDIARRTLEDYTRDARALSHVQAIEQVLGYNHVVASVAVWKFRLVNRALSLLRIAMPLWMFVLLVLALAR